MEEKKAKKPEEKTYPIEELSTDPAILAGVQELKKLAPGTKMSRLNFEKAEKEFLDAAMSKRGG